jgi:uncharacterized damage-inducible protein DinB
VTFAGSLSGANANASLVSPSRLVRGAGGVVLGVGFGFTVGALLVVVVRVVELVVVDGVEGVAPPEDGETARGGASPPPHALSARHRAVSQTVCRMVPEATRARADETRWCLVVRPAKIVRMASKAQKYPDLWVDPEDDPRETDSSSIDERAVLLDYLRHFRLTFEMKCDDLDAEHMARRSVEPSTLSLLGLLRHLAKVEQTWFRITMEGNDIPRLYVSDGNPDGDFDGAVADDAVVAEAWESWRREVAHAEAFVEASESLEVMSTHPTRDPISLRELLVHMIEEYARHCGHADLIRERIDGRTGQ